MAATRPILRPFAGADEEQPCPQALLVEARAELLREAQHHLSGWERSGDPVARGRLLQSLDALRLLIAG